MIKTSKQASEQIRKGMARTFCIRSKDKSEISKPPQNSEGSVELLKEGQECPFCHFSKLKKNGDEVICPVCGYGHRACT